MLYAATLRLIDNTRAMSEAWLKEWAESNGIPKLGQDGTIQFHIETLPVSSNHLFVPLAQLDNKNYPEMLDTVYRQGYAACIRDRVTFKGW